MTFFWLEESDYISCEMCGCQGQDIHHIKARGLGGSKCMDYIENLICLCRDCHNRAERDKQFNTYCRIQHLENIKKYLYENYIDRNKQS